MLGLFEHFKLVAIQVLIDLVPLQALLLNDFDCAGHLSLDMLTQFDRPESSRAQL